MVSRRPAPRTSSTCGLSAAAFASAASLIPALAPGQLPHPFDPKAMLAGPNGFQFVGPQYDRVGASLASGDIDGDGLSDLVTGAPGVENSAGSFYNEGATYVVFGVWPPSSVAAQQAPSDLTGARGFGGFGLNAYDYMGRAVACGDFNGDGFDDFATASPNANSVENYNTGLTLVVFGGTSVSPPTGNLDFSTAPVQIAGENADSYTGFSCANAGDFNGDGYDDLLIGGSYEEYDSSESSAWLLFGGPNGPAGGGSVSLESLTPAQGFKMTTGKEDGLGRSVAGAGDFNGDGFADILVGAPEDSISSEDIYSRGTTYLVFGTAGTVGTSGLLNLRAPQGATVVRINGSANYDRAGWSVAGAGDTNGDGFGDVLIGARSSDPGGVYNAGSAFLVFGGAGELGTGGEFGLANVATRGVRLDGYEYDAQAGRAVSGAGDVNGDGFDDILIGAPRTEIEGEYAGRAFLVYGAPGGPGTAGAFALADIDGTNGVRFDGSGYDFQLGVSVSPGGDSSGDGIDDLQIGASSNYGAGTAFVVFGVPKPGTNPGYNAFARAGDAPPREVGSSRAVLDFENGTGPGAGGASLQTVTLSEGPASKGALPAPGLGTVWRVQTDRTGATNTRLTLLYSEDEADGFDESQLDLYRSASPDGPWTTVEAGVVREPNRNRISAVVPDLGYFTIAGPQAPVEPAFEGFAVR